MGKKINIEIDTEIIRNKIEFFEKKFQSNKIFYIYVDYTNDGIPFYVGKGLKRRLLEKRRNKKHVWVSKNYGLNRIILFSDLNEQWILVKEIQYIKLLDTFNPDFKDYSDLKCNLTYGGDGCSGFIIPKETLKKRIKGKKRSKETKRKLSNANIKRWRNEIEREKLITASKKRWERPGEKEKTSKSLMGKFCGEKSQTALFTNKQANNIRDEYQQGNITQKQLAIKYNTSRSTITNIINNKSYKQIDYCKIKKTKFKLTNEQAKIIRKKYAIGNISQKELGIKYNVSEDTINKIIKNKIYKDI